MTVLTPQNVANSPTNSYPVAKFRTVIDGKTLDIQGVTLVDSDGLEYNDSNPFPTSGTFAGTVTVVPLTSDTATEDLISVGNTAGGTLILASNPDRKGGVVRVSISAAVSVNIAFGLTADANSRLYAPGDQIPLTLGGVIYTGPITGYVNNVDQTVEVTEL